MMRRNARMKRDVFLADIGTRPLIMGIFNVTPDSFFDGGRYIAGGASRFSSFSARLCLIRRVSWLADR